MAFDLINASNATQVANKISPSLSRPIKNAIASTVLSLAEIQRAFDDDSSLSTFLPDQLVLLPPKAQGVQTPDASRLNYLRGLAVVANTAAETLNCSSILAGQASESDDSGDVSLWLGEGEFGPGNEAKVLRLLELDSWLQNGAIISRVALHHDSTLPSTIPHRGSGPDLEEFKNKLNEMSERYCFEVRSPKTDPLVVFFYLGRFERGDWGGLLGIGTWSDN